MANTIQLKRRVSGVAGAPAALKSGELAHNEVDDTLYVGKGDDGTGDATSIVPLAGSGGFLALAGTQTVGGAKTFTFRLAGPFGATSPNSARCPRSALMSCVRCLTKHWCVRKATARPCVSALFTATNRMVGREAASAMASASALSFF